MAFRLKHLSNHEQYRKTALAWVLTSSTQKILGVFCANDSHLDIGLEPTVLNMPRMSQESVGETIVSVHCIACLVQEFRMVDADQV